MSQRTGFHGFLQGVEKSLDTWEKKLGGFSEAEERMVQEIRSAIDGLVSIKESAPVPEAPPLSENLQRLVDLSRSKDS